MLRLAEGDTVAGVLAMERHVIRLQDALSSVAQTEQSAVVAPHLFALGTVWASRPEDRDRGLRMLRRPSIWSPVYEVLSRFHIAKALEAEGDTEGARAAYAWFVDALAEADPGLPVLELVEEARTALARLGGE